MDNRIKNDNTMSKDKKELEEEQVDTENQTTEAPDETPVEESEQKKDGKKHRDKHDKHASKHDEQTEKLQELGEKLAETNDKYVRLYSEYENYRKRTNSEKAELIINGSKETIKAILPVVDDMERALQAMSDEESAKEGVQLIYNKLMNILGQKGLKAIEAKGEKFDENLHEAVTQFPAADESMKGMVVDVVEKGYYLNDKVLRYAKVVVAV